MHCRSFFAAFPHIGTARKKDTQPPLSNWIIYDDAPLRLVSSKEEPVDFLPTNKATSIIGRWRSFVLRCPSSSSSRNIRCPLCNVGWILSSYKQNKNSRRRRLHYSNGRRLPRQTTNKTICLHFPPRRLDWPTAGKNRQTKLTSISGWFACIFIQINRPSKCLQNNTGSLVVAGIYIEDIIYIYIFVIIIYWFIEVFFVLFLFSDLHILWYTFVKEVFIVTKKNIERHRRDCADEMLHWNIASWLFTNVTIR